MAFRHGKNASITINAVDLTTFTDSVDLSIDVDTGDTTALNSTWKSALPGIPGAKLELSGFYDPTASTGPSAALIACITGGTAVAVIHKPGGTATGQRSNTFNAIVTSFAESSPVGGIVKFKAGLLVTGAVTSAVI